MRSKLSEQTLAELAEHYHGSVTQLEGALATALARARHTRKHSTPSPVTAPAKPKRKPPGHPAQPT